MNNDEFKFREKELLEEMLAYVESTYDQHYADGKYQATDVIIDAGFGVGFCLGNVIKYAKRYGKKGTVEDHRKDLLKVLHYALIMLYLHDEENASPENENPMQLNGETILCQSDIPKP